MLEWGAALRWVWTSASANEVREKTAALGGTAMLYAGEFTSQEVGLQQGHSTPALPPSRFHPLSSAVLKIHQRLKAELDPHGVFNPSKMYPGL